MKRTAVAGTHHLAAMFATEITEHQGMAIMSNVFYYDKSGNRVGPVAAADLKTLAERGVIEPKTLIENHNGQSVLAEQVKSLTFPEKSPAEPVPPPEPFAPTPGTPFVSAVPGADPPLSRAVFIFLAVFVGIFGVHDFYAKRVRQGRIHLALLLPWILVVVASILSVFAGTLFVLGYSPHRKEIQEIHRALKDGEKKINELGQKRVELEQELEAARSGRKPFVPQQEERKRIVPQQEEQKRIVPQQEEHEPFVPQREEQKRIIPQWEEQERIIPQQEEQEPIAPPPIEIDREYVWELQNSLQDLLNSSEDLEYRQKEMQDTLINLKLQQGVKKLPEWVGLGSLWTYFFFYILPLVSWVMAMMEIVYVTKDGNDRVFGF